MLGGLTLADFLRLQAADGEQQDEGRSAILVFLSGGPAHQDTFDLKPDAPAEYRGQFRPMDTSAPGVRICEHLPKLAQRSIATHTEGPLDRVARAHLVRHGADAANPRGDVRRFGRRPTAQHRFKQPGRLEDAELNVDDPFPFELNHQRTLALDAGKLANGDHPGPASPVRHVAPPPSGRAPPPH